jgi:hypothetical protein
MLLVASFLLASNVQAYVTGHVVNLITNEPVPNAEVTLTCVEAEYRAARCQTINTKTSQDGTFSFTVAYPAKYLLSADASGMAQIRNSSTELVISYRRHIYNFSGDLQLAPESTISGEVVDLDKHPRPGIQVIAWRQYTTGPFTRLRSVSKAVSNDSGDYVFHKLAPGNYYVAALLRRPGTPPPKRNQDVEGFLIYAPSAFTLNDASVIHLEIGQSTTNVELCLRSFATYHLEGRAQMEPMGQAISGKPSLYLDPRDQNGLTAPGRELELRPDGKFEASVLPGFYTLRLVGTTTQSATKTFNETQPMLLHLLAKQDIEISGKDAYGILILISPAFTVGGHVSVEGQPNELIKSGEIKLEAVDLIAPTGSLVAKIQADGSFSISNADAVTYAVRYSPPSGMYAKSIEVNGQDALSHYLDLSSSAGGEMRIVLRPGAGSVTVSNGPNSTSSQVTLIPDFWINSSLTPVIYLAPYEKAFSATGLTPGHYTAVATARLDQQTWANDAFVQEMRSRGTPFELRENEQKLITPAEVSKDEINRIELQLGIY